MSKSNFSKFLEKCINQVKKDNAELLESKHIIQNNSTLVEREMACSSVPIYEVQDFNHDVFSNNNFKS